MARRIILLSGPIGVGKTTLTDTLHGTYQARVIKTRDLLDLEARARLAHVRTRSEYQAFGELLDAKDGGKWVAAALEEALRRETAELIVVDSVRILGQIRAIREAYSYSVFHIHLTASEKDLRERFNARVQKFQEAPSYEASQENATEKGVRQLEEKATRL